MKWHEQYTTVDDTTWKKVGRAATNASGRCALFQGDTCAVLAKLPSACVNTVVTSPPYWNVRDYGLEGQLGTGSLEDYVNYLVRAFDEIKRILVPGGAVWLNLGDTYFNTAVTENGVPPERGWKRAKQLALVPFRVAIALEDAGWWVRNVVVWRKTNAMPSSVRDRLTNCWEPGNRLR